MNLWKYNHGEKYVYRPTGGYRPVLWYGYGKILTKDDDNRLQLVHLKSADCNWTKTHEADGTPVKPPEDNDKPTVRSFDGQPYELLPETIKTKMLKADEVCTLLYKAIMSASHLKFQFLRVPVEVKSPDGEWQHFKPGDRLDAEFKMIVPEESEGKD